MTKWLDHHYDYDDPPKQKSGPDNRDLIQAGEGSVNKRREQRQKKLKAALEADMSKQAAKEAERAKGTLELCRVCKKFFRTPLENVSICPTCEAVNKC
ncbi:MAG TPA: hypothetical protein VFV23_04895 [Verrucomicrobiae bacterium]|nr:hypothetical protein [Verrucomicrobiae bacterium]